MLTNKPIHGGHSGMALVEELGSLSPELLDMTIE